MTQHVGFGFDVHRFAEGRPLMIGGVEVPFRRGLAGHSDADVLLHAICDAVLGAMGEGDIGQLFPNHDPQYKDIASILLLKEVSRIAKERRWRIVNIDCTVVAEAPKISPHRMEMEAKIAETLGMTGGGQRQGHHDRGAGLHRQRRGHGGLCGCAGGEGGGVVEREEE